MNPDSVPLSPASPCLVAPHPDSEEALENAVLSQIFDQLLGWEPVVAYSETLGPDGTLGRDSWDEVVLTRYLRDALQRFNPDAPAEAINLALEDLTRDLSTLTLASANREIYDLLKKRGAGHLPRQQLRTAGADPAGHRLAQLLTMQATQGFDIRCRPCRSSTGATPTTTTF